MYKEAASYFWTAFVDFKERFGLKSHHTQRSAFKVLESLYKDGSIGNYRYCIDELIFSLIPMDEIHYLFGFEKGKLGAYLMKAGYEEIW